jgi:hypothetical protein
MSILRVTTPLAFLLLLAGALLSGAPTDAAQTASNADPQIERARIGLANCYKIGHWTPVRVEISGLQAQDNAAIEVTVIDSDGVATTAAAPCSPMESTHTTGAVTLYTKVGKLGAPIQIVLADGNRRMVESTLWPGRHTNGESSLVELPATSELIVVLGSDQVGLRQAVGDREASAGGPARRLVEVKSVDDLPTQWFGYDAVDVFVISASDKELCHQLVTDSDRFQALIHWIELGGRLVFMCGGQDAAELLADGASLASLVPGRVAEMVRVTETSQLEQFAEPAGPIPGRGGSSAISIPRLVDVTGAVEARAGQRLSDPPVVVRSARGLGQITFSGVDLTQSPLADWNDRHRFVQALLRPYLTDDQPEDSSQMIVARGYNDLSGALRQRLGRSFTSLAPIGFPLVAVLAIAYLLFLGPLDYLLVQRWLRQPLLAWITLPAIVLAFGMGTLAIARWREGSSVARVNRLELVDVDMKSGTARGTFWATLHSPRASRFDLTLEVDPPVVESNAKATALLSWWGLPGTGIGGMQSRAANLEIIQTGYRYGRGLAELKQVPLLTLSTKSLSASWTAPINLMLETQLRDQDGFATGRIVNKTGRRLHSARLLYRNWGYRLGDLDDSQQVDVGEFLEPRSAKTILTSNVLSAAESSASRAEGAVFLPDRASALELLNLMMFYEACGGARFGQLPNQYQANGDLSWMLRPGIDRAILVAEVSDSGSRLVDQSKGEKIGDDFAAVVYRFVIPVASNADQ